ncbi:hypothetical protein GAP32_471 [Cronobacter phage vB_CsaM_GAP32]|uniref:Uncharacterized protein n=1 Tax=Cronobacter phage vB_CsaM_GAP32 TaxID=1141136 RepID=K4FB90_9CAUD|nr:hypothetical protein GAP32_471 [Cronobacter phage vB_CsaM_GAP32]AFC21929.1 hypothetical protein GAP32_471 [Cronobacter phage vB_CsaM_GAP32]
MSKLTPERLSQIENQLMNLQHELQTVIIVDDSIKKSAYASQNHIVGSIAEARNELNYLIKSIKATYN